MDPAQELQKSRHSIMRVNRQRDAAAPRKKRVAFSCAPCRKRKTKCNRLSPCNHCQRLKITGSCDYSPSSEGPSLLNQRAKRQRVSSATESMESSPVSISEPEDHINSADIPTQLPDEGTDDCSNPAPGFNIAHPAPVSPVKSVPPSTSEYLASQPVTNAIQSLSHLSFRGKDDRTRFFGRSHWALTLKMFPDLRAHLHDYQCTNIQRSQADVAEYIALKRLKQDMRSKETPATHGSQKRLEELIPDRRIADHLLHLYFSTFETTFRILHVSQFLTEYKAFWDANGAGSGTRDVFAAKLLALMACSSCFADESIASGTAIYRSLSQRATHWIQAVISWVESTPTTTRLTLDMIQIKCLLLIGREAIAYEGDLTWLNAGSLIREAMTLGLHRDPSNFHAVSPYWAETRRRLWMTIIELDLQAALDSGMPVSITEDDFDCSPPSNVDDEDVLPESKHMPPSKPLGISTRTSFQVALTQSLGTRIEIVRTINRVRLTSNYSGILRLSDTLTTTLSQAPSYLKDNAGSEDNPAVAFQKSLFLFLVYRCLLALHRPFFLSLADTHNAIFTYSKQMCIQLSLALLAQLESPSDKPTGETRDYPYLLRLKGGMFRDDIFHAATTICFELRLQAKDKIIPPLPGTSADLLHQATSSQRAPLFRAVENTIKYFEIKVRTEKRACKAFMFLHMVLASAKSHDHSSGSSNKNSDSFVLEEACPRASRRCRELLFADENRSAGIVFNSESQHSSRPTTRSQQLETWNPTAPPALPGNPDTFMTDDLFNEWDLSFDPLFWYPTGFSPWPNMDPLV